MYPKITVFVALSVFLSSHAIAGGLWSSVVDTAFGQTGARAISEKLTSSTERNIDEVLSGINKDMPSKVDEMTTLKGLKRTDRTIIYDYVFNIYQSKLTIETRKGLRQKLIDLTCSDGQNVTYMKNGNEFMYRYSSLNGDLLLGQRVSLKYCGG
jgi:hypothetical protein